MGFMKLQIVNRLWIVGENDRGEGFTIEADLIPLPEGVREIAPKVLDSDTQAIIGGRILDYVDGIPAPESIAVRYGWAGRYSAPGYMDRTAWVGPFATEDEARRGTIALYGDDEEEGEDEEV